MNQSALADSPPAASNGEPSAEELRRLNAEASTAHQGINIPLNVANWKHLDEATQAELLWYHQYLLTNRVPQKEIPSTLNYDYSTIFRVLKGTYSGNWANVVRAIQGYRKLVEQRGKIQKNEFAENSISREIFAALDYALANNSLTVIEGESRVGKTVSSKEWARQNNHGKTVWIEAPVIGGVSAFVKALAKEVGVGQNQPINDIAEAIYKAFNKNRILIIDEAHRLLPGDARTTNPQKIEFPRSLHDRTGCAVAFMVTARWSKAISRGTYQYEQLVGRIGMPVTLLRPPKVGGKPTIKRADILPIVKQFIKAPTASLLDKMDRIANAPGRLGILVETLKAASRIASVDKETLDEKHVDKAIAMRTAPSGGSEGER